MSDGKSEAMEAMQEKPIQLALPHPPEREEWRPIPGHVGYEVSSSGAVRSYWRRGGTHSELLTEPQGMIATSVYTPLGHTQVIVGTKGERRSVWKIHRLVLTVFVCPSPFAGAEGRHLDGNARNNSINNLCWSTHKENEADKIRHGTHLRGESKPGAKLREPQVLDIVRRVRAGERQSVVADEMQISRSTVCDILKGRQWGWLTGIPDLTNYAA